jgi:primosomal protein N' (replication factor Y)
MLVEVAVPAPLTHSLTYRVPPLLAGGVEPGSRVLVELGRRRMLGVVLSVTAKAPEGVRLKEVLDVIDREPVLPAELLRFMMELASYYFAPIGEVMKLALPALDRDEAEKIGEADKVGGASHVVGKKRVKIAIPTDKLEAPGSLRGNAAALLTRLRLEGEIPVARLGEIWSNARSVVTKLSDLGLIRVEEREPPRDPFFQGGVERDEAPPPTASQGQAMARIDRSLLDHKPEAFLLHGITGSGKTEVYLHAIETCLEQKRGALMLVPEIALTPQLVGRFRARFGDGLAVLHSGLSPRDRLMMWKALRERQVNVAIGARSALFAPVPDLGLLVVDEEHDGSFKQEEGVRYHARDMAILRAHRAGAVSILGSATPSLESEHLARTGRLTRLKLPMRARAAATLPEVQIVDLRRVGPGPSGDPRISLTLHKRMDETLARGEQIILFLNRRGFAPSVVCDDCGHVATCPLCSVALTFHMRARHLRCHYCDYQRPSGGPCTACKSDKLTLEGVGTERLEDSVRRAFPSARVARLDRDVASGAKAEEILTRLREGKIDILIGTQMVAKGHDVPSVTLVGVINADAALSMPDLRATERAFQLLVQVAGRAGRGAVRGHVIFQTRDTENPAVVGAATHDVEGFIERELESRAELAYPPFSRLAMVRVDAVNEDHARQAITALAEVARMAPVCKRREVEVLGPAPSPLSRLRARFRFQLMFKAKDRKALRAVAAVVIEAQRNIPSSIRVFLDIDPVSML